MGWGSQVANVQRRTQRAFSISKPVTYEPNVGAPYSVEFSVFRAAGLEIDADSGLEILTTNPEISWQLSDLQAAPVEGDHVSIPALPELPAAEGRWMIVKPMPDGEGCVKAGLRRGTPP